MRHHISWSDLSGCTVGIYGLGREGEANLRAALARDLDPILVDDDPARTEISGIPIISSYPDGINALLRCDVVVKAPGISRYSDQISLLERSGVAVVGGVGLWLQEADLSKVLCITGTKGKSTTAAITGHLLARLGYRCLVGGNFGLPPHDTYAEGDYDYWVIEISSYQATDLARSSPVGVVTSLHADHLPWHRGDPETYFRDKLSATSQQGKRVTIANGDSGLLRARSHLLADSVRWVCANDDPAGSWMKELNLLGTHNRRNALIARASLQEIGVPEASEDDLMQSAAKNFRGLPSRLNVVGFVGGVTFVDDSLSTNVLPTVAAVEVFPDRRIALIVGGQSRGIDYRPLGAALRSRVVDLMLITVPDNGPEIRRQVENAGLGDHVEAVDVADLAEAVQQGYRWARPDGIVLLSPAAPSFGRFRDYHERAVAFTAVMETCRDLTGCQ